MGDTTQRLRAMTHFQRGRHFFNVAKYEHALGAFDQAIATDPDFLRSYAGKANSLTMLGRLDDALEAVDVGLQRDPGAAIIYTMRGAILRRLGRVDEAHADYRLALKLGADDPVVHFNFACFWAELGNRDECERFLKQALTMDPHLNTSAATDPELARYRDEPWFAALVAFK